MLGWGRGGRGLKRNSKHSGRKFNFPLEGEVLETAGGGWGGDISGKCQ
jgi:hypothetical protein